MTNQRDKPTIGRPNPWPDEDVITHVDGDVGAPLPPDCKREWPEACKTDTPERVVVEGVKP
jgi:hypothetical protein